MHPPIPHRTSLAHFVAGGGQPIGRVEVVRAPDGMDPRQRAAQMVIQALLNNPNRNANA